MKNGGHQRIHQGQRNKNQKQHTEEFAREVIKSRHRLGKDRVKGAILRILWQKQGGRHHG